MRVLNIYGRPDLNTMTKTEKNVLQALMQHEQREDLYELFGAADIRDIDWMYIGLGKDEYFMTVYSLYNIGLIDHLITDRPYRGEYRVGPLQA